jgi:hypothetical protein
MSKKNVFMMYNNPYYPEYNHYDYSYELNYGNDNIKTYHCKNGTKITYDNTNRVDYDYGSTSSSRKHKSKK